MNRKSIELLAASLRKSYEEVEPHLPPEVKEHFDAIPRDRRDWFKRQLFEDSMVPGAMNRYAYSTMGVAKRPGVHVKLDSNDLKALNDQLGHASGDQAITSLGSVALQSARTHGGQLFRTGGDEFDMHFQTPEQAHGALRHLSQGVDALVPMGGHHKLSFSAGIGESPEHADRALYLAKGAKTAQFGDMRHDPMAITGHGVHFVHSLLPGAAGPVATAAPEPTIPASLSVPKRTEPMPMPEPMAKP